MAKGSTRMISLFTGALPNGPSGTTREYSQSSKVIDIGTRIPTGAFDLIGPTGLRQTLLQIAQQSGGTLISNGLNLSFCIISFS
jgi:hypothetical protein